MPGTRTAPTINGSPVYRRVSVQLIDNTGNKASDVIICPPTVTDAEIETYVAKYALATNASIYRVEVTDSYGGQQDAGNAATQIHDDVDQVINFLMKSDSDDHLSQRAVLRAPLDSFFQAESDVILWTQQAYADWYTAASALYNGGAGGSGDYSSRSSKYQQRKGTNNKRVNH